MREHTKQRRMSPALEILEHREVLAAFQATGILTGQLVAGTQSRPSTLPIDVNSGGDETREDLDSGFEGYDILDYTQFVNLNIPIFRVDNTQAVLNEKLDRSSIDGKGITSINLKIVPGVGESNGQEVEIAFVFSTPFSLSNDYGSSVDFNQNYVLKYDDNTYLLPYTGGQRTYTFDTTIGSTISLVGSMSFSGSLNTHDSAGTSFLGVFTINQVFPEDHPDLAPAGLNLDLSSGTIDVSYEVSGAPLTDDGSLDLYWAKGTDPKSDLLGSPVDHYCIKSVADKTVGTHSVPTYHFTNSQLDNIPPNATHLIAVVNGGGDSDQSNNAKPGTVPLSWQTKVPSSFTNPDGSVTTRDQFTQKVRDIAAAIGTNPSYVMTVLAIETNGKFDPKKDEGSGTSRSVGLFSFTGESAVDALNDLGVDKLAQYIGTDALKQYFGEDALIRYKDKPLFFKTSKTPKATLLAYGTTAQNIINNYICAINQLNLGLLWLQKSKFPDSVKLKGAKLSNLGDFYATIFSNDLVGSNDDTVIGVGPQNNIPPLSAIPAVRLRNQYTSDFERMDLVVGGDDGPDARVGNGDGLMTTKEVRNYLRYELKKGFQ